MIRSHLKHHVLSILDPSMLKVWARNLSSGYWDDRFKVGEDSDVPVVAEMFMVAQEVLDETGRP